MCRLRTLNIFISDDLIETAGIADFTSSRSGTYAHNALQCTANLIDDADDLGRTFNSIQITDIKIIRLMFVDCDDLFCRIH